jgi:hypothetical protein
MTTLEVPQSEVIHLAIVAGLYLGGRGCYGEKNNGNVTPH